jgi:hypothetical protein
MHQGVERLVLTTLTENYVDMLLPDGPSVTRAGLAHYFDAKRVPGRRERGRLPPGGGADRSGAQG